MRNKRKTPKPLEPMGQVHFHASIRCSLGDLLALPDDVRDALLRGMAAVLSVKGAVFEVRTAKDPLLPAERAAVEMLRHKMICFDDEIPGLLAAFDKHCPRPEPARSPGKETTTDG